MIEIGREEEGGKEREREKKKEGEREERGSSLYSQRTALANAFRVQMH